MGIQGRPLQQMQFEAQIQRIPKVLLVRANPWNCSGPGSLCFKPPRQNEINLDCPVCNGTGYLGGHRNATDTTIAPYSKSYRIYADLQTGHGLYGSGGDYTALIAQMGKMEVGDATIFTKMYDYDQVTGKRIYPLVSPKLPVPDRIVDPLSGNVYNVVKEIIARIGVDEICRIFTLEEGILSATNASMGTK